MYSQKNRSNVVVSRIILSSKIISFTTEFVYVYYLTIEK